MYHYHFKARSSLPFSVFIHQQFCSLNLISIHFKTDFGS